MANEILDSEVIDPIKLKSKLNAAGLNKHFGDKNNSIIVQESDTVQVRIFFDGKFNTRTKAVFPQIGNSIQIVSTVILLAVSFYLQIPSILPWIIGVLGGQVISLLVHLPKINKLKAKVDAAIS